MKLIVFGATGATGKRIVEQALEQGHLVTAFVRDPSKLGLMHSNLTIAKGDIMDLASVIPAIQGQEAVLCAIGAPANKTGNIRSEGTKNIIQAMKATGVKRLICQTSMGYGDSKKFLDQTPFIFKHIIVPFILKKAFADHALQEEYIKQSQLDWIIARPANLTDEAYTGVYKQGFPLTEKKLKMKISRADVADFMLKQLTTNTYLRKTPGLSY
ncbi:NAD(P)-dependent oxidoreductase [Chitinophaga filiformis]|uniref:Putative NADH-flavin reductase n=1 Tax=Chitinophaga filiformis TaxID=104663 RepID=A0A1G7Y1D0_CHIFI|nr:SDR family oxidoreductase [Chitinophaga filiformis]SDG90194.1 Putative NADH-flavin reductase [Chitinophaga filiformis]